jgi:hypothetical protein
MIERDAALETVISNGNEWQRWRAFRIRGEKVGDPPAIRGQDGEGGFYGPTGRVSPGATGLALCEFVVLGLDVSGPATIAADWLLEARTPAEAWLDAPDDVPGPLEDPAAGRVWATAGAACGLLAVARDPGPRALTLLRGEADLEGRFTGGAYPTFAAAAVHWLAEGPQTEMAEWSLRWVREWQEDWWGPWEFVTGLTFWAAAGIPAEHGSVDHFLDELSSIAPPQGWADDPELTTRCLELMHHFEY